MDAQMQQSLTLVSDCLHHPHTHTHAHTHARTHTHQMYHSHHLSALVSAPVDMEEGDTQGE